MISNIGDTPKQLEQGLMFDGEVWTKDRIQALQAQVVELTRLLNYQEKQTEELVLIAIGEVNLAERDAEIAAKTVDECIDIAHSKFSVTGITSTLQDYANQLRQAKGGE